MENRLEHLKEFKNILAHYQISERGKRMLASNRLVFMAGPTSSGRNTIINALVETGQYHQIISDTTRHPRKNNGVLEQDGVEYWFRTEEEVLEDLKAGRYLEAALIHNQQVSGMSLRELERAQSEHKIAVNEIEIVGMHKIVQAKPDVFALFVVPPSFKIWMQRMDARGKLSAVEKRRRLESAILEFEAALSNGYYVFIVNEDFHQSVERIHERVIQGKHDPTHQSWGRAVIEKLLIDTRAYLESQK